MPVDPRTGQTSYDPRLMLGQALLRRQNQPRTAIEGANNAANSIVGALLTRKAMEAQESKDSERAAALGQALQKFQAGDTQAGMAALAGSNDPAVQNMLLGQYLTGPMSPRDKAFADLTPDQQARALGGLPTEMSPRDRAFSGLTPDQQAKALGAGPDKPEARRVYDDPNGIRRYEDTGQPVFPGIEKQPGVPDSAGDVTAPILAKIAKGEPITPAEQQALDVAAQLDPLKVLMRDLLQQQTPAAPTAEAAPAAPGPGAAPAETPVVGGGAQAAEPAAPQIGEDEALRQAREALARAPNKRGAIERRLQDLGFDPSKL
jgi:hypothetical protein